MTDLPPQKPEIQIPSSAGIPVNQGQIPVQTVPVPPVRKKPLKAYALAVVLLFIIGAGGIFYFSGRSRPGITPDGGAQTPTPTGLYVQGVIHPIATDSAYLEAQSSVASLSAALKAYSPQDSTINPPVLDLDLGF